jgi:hypothetical protein
MKGQGVMLNLPYVASALDNATLLPAEAGPDRDSGISLGELDRRKCDAILDALTADAQRIPECVGVCLVTGGAHDYNFQTALVQLRHGMFLTQSWDNLGGLNTVLAPVTFALDLPEALYAIRHDSTILRGPGNRNVDRNTGLENRVSTVYLVVGTDGEWVNYPRPLLHGHHPNTAANRIFRVMLRLEDKMTLI